MLKRWCFSSLMVMLFCFQAEALLCRQLFQIEVSAKLQDIFAGQDRIGVRYAWIKALHDAKLPLDLKLEKLTDDQRKKLMKNLKEEVDIAKPAIRDPQGRLFLLDGNHELYILSRLEQNGFDWPIKLYLVGDFSHFTDIQFLKAVQDNHWFHVESLIDWYVEPKKFLDLKNSTERSMIGLVFLLFQDNHDVPMKGSLFTPFVQFYLAELLTKNSLFAFHEDFSNKDVQDLKAVILQSRIALSFLIESLRPEAPKKLRKFLEDALDDASKRDKRSR